MKSIRLFAILSFLLLSGNFAIGQNSNDLKSNGLKGMVKSITKTTYGANDSLDIIKKHQAPDEISYTSYDRKGNEIENWNKDIKDLAILFVKCKNKYNLFGHRIKKTEFSRFVSWSQMSIRDKRCNYYDKQENLTKSYYYDYRKAHHIGHIFEGKRPFNFFVKAAFNYDLLTMDAFRYDANNNIIEECRYAKNNYLIFRLSYKYDSLNNLMQKNDYGRANWESLKYFSCTKNCYKYDSKNHLIENTLYGSDTDLFNKTDRDKLVSITTYTYDKSVNQYKGITYDSLHRITDEYILEYDSLGNKTLDSHLEYFSTSPHCEQEIRKYQYDKTGNCIVEIWLHDPIFPCNEKYRADLEYTEIKIEYYGQKNSASW